MYLGQSAGSAVLKALISTGESLDATNLSVWEQAFVAGAGSTSDTGVIECYVTGNGSATVIIRALANGGSSSSSEIQARMLVLRGT
jgi:hypothetical protein